MTARTFAFTKTTPYYRRHRALPMLISSDELSAEPVDMLITRYGDQGSRYYRPWDAYYHDGRFYRIVSHVVALDEDGTPCDEPLYTLDVLDLHPEHKSAWDKAKASYYSFLDYDEDSFGTVTDYAETK